MPYKAGDKYMNFKNFMNGRYGVDILSKVIILVALMFCLFRYTRLLGLLFIGVAFYRILSRDIFKRQQEKIRFDNFLKDMAFKFGSKAMGYKTQKPFNQRVNDWFSEKKNYKIVQCSRCNQKLRVPRGKGKIIITCRKCGYEFKAKS
ncbi:Zn-finger containing protein [Clostridium sp. TW13]|uniref:Zn-finger containing protein n=1 Tax=Inconstantimicrobium mannanitabidum TaxID=1604901 RepID=A0ACB5RHV6_9CLOT|nr:Zn-finger containing protein [Clostridium sp. TW13]